MDWACGSRHWSILAETQEKQALELQAEAGFQGTGFRDRKIPGVCLSTGSGARFESGSWVVILQYDKFVVVTLIDGKGR